VTFLPPAAHVSEKTPQILQVYRDFPKSGSFEEYGKIEEDAAHICTEFDCPHPYIALESLTGHKEVWFLNGYKSHAEREKVALDYANNPPLMAALKDIARRKSALVFEPIELFANLRPGMSRGTPWTLGQSRFVIATLTILSLKVEGTVFETEDGKRLIMNSAQSSKEARALAAASQDTHVFAVRPLWSIPDRKWSAADPAFWNPLTL
jgi:hypothetical protein